jgi:hypothetical protein
MKIKSLNGVEAQLLWSGDDYFIRIYDNNGLTFEDGFEDCKIKHSDLTIVIDDEDAYLYEDDDGNVWIDHSPETLGLKPEVDSEEAEIAQAFQAYLESIRGPTDPSRPKAIAYTEEEFNAFRAAWMVWTKARE